MNKTAHIPYIVLCAVIGAVLGAVSYHFFGPYPVLQDTYKLERELQIKDDAIEGLISENSSLQQEVAAALKKKASELSDTQQYYDQLVHRSKFNVKDRLFTYSNAFSFSVPKDLGTLTTKAFLENGIGFTTDSSEFGHQVYVILHDLQGEDINLEETQEKIVNGNSWLYIPSETEPPQDYFFKMDMLGDVDDVIVHIGFSTPPRGYYCTDTMTESECDTYRKEFRESFASEKKRFAGYVDHILESFTLLKEQEEENS